MPYLPQWIEQVHEEQLRLEAAGTSRIEGAAFTQSEQEEALAPDPPEHAGLTHSSGNCGPPTHLPLDALTAGRPVGHHRFHPGDPPTHRDRL